MTVIKCTPRICLRTKLPIVPRSYVAGGGDEFLRGKLPDGQLSAFLRRSTTKDFRRFVKFICTHRKHAIAQLIQLICFLPPSRRHALVRVFLSRNLRQIFIIALRARVPRCETREIPSQYRILIPQLRYDVRADAIVIATGSTLIMPLYLALMDR